MDVVKAIINQIKDNPEYKPSAITYFNEDSQQWETIKE